MRMEHWIKLQSRDLIRHALLPHLAYAEPLISASLLTPWHSGLCCVFCLVMLAPLFSCEQTFLSCVIVVIGTSTCGESYLTLEASFLHMCMLENCHAVFCIVNTTNASEHELHGLSKKQNPCHLLFNALPFQPPLEKQPDVLKTQSSFSVLSILSSLLIQKYHFFFNSF